MPAGKMPREDKKKKKTLVWGNSSKIFLVNSLKAWDLAQITQFG